MDRGLFRSLHYKGEFEEERSLGGEMEQFENPSLIPNISGLKHANYDKLAADGIVNPGTIIEFGDVIIGKTVVVSTLDSTQNDGRLVVKRDRSVIFNQHEPYIVDTVAHSTNRDGMRMVRVKLRAHRIPIVGDKLCMTADHDILTFHGWKSINSLELSDLLATLSSTNVNVATVQWQPVLALFEYELKTGTQMINYTSKYVDQLVTCQHKIPVYNPYAKNWSLVAASYLDEVTSVLLQGSVGVSNIPMRNTKRQQLFLLLSDTNKCYSAEVTNYIQKLAVECGLNCIAHSTETGFYLELHTQEAAILTDQNKQVVTTTCPTKVYCPTVGGKTSVVYVRRNGKCSWTGNSSRHGQKGTIGLILPQIDMPFSNQTGMCPDIIISPHAIPSRMTLGQLLESIASKTGAMLGKFMDATAFGDVSTETLCNYLHKTGFEKFGNERLINGMTGEPLEASVFMGPVFYQRLKHMVYDKIHARTTGAVTIISRQPPEGRSRDGGLRFGEMERDCLLAHGCASTLQAQLSDDSFSTPICRDCGSLAIPKHAVTNKPAWCKRCNSKNVVMQSMPYAYKVLLQELSGIHVDVSHYSKNK